MGDLVALTKDKLEKQLSGFGIERYSLADYVDPDDGVTKFLLQINCGRAIEISNVGDFLAFVPDVESDVIATFKVSDV